jgi:hypothetical protein
MNMTPFAEGGVVYGVDQPGQFRAMRIATGERLWESWLPVTGAYGGRGVSLEELLQTLGPAEADVLKPRGVNGFDRRPRHVAEEKVRLVGLELLAAFPLLFGEERLIHRRPVDL